MQIVECRGQWIVLDGKAKEVGKQSLCYFAKEEGIKLTTNNDITLEKELFYHRKCYQIFTKYEANRSSKEKGIEHSPPQRLFVLP